MNYFFKRILQVIPVLFGMSIITFFIIYAIPGDPAIVLLGNQASAEAIEELRTQLGLNESLFQQYIHYIQGILQGDLGTSLRTGQSIFTELAPALTATAELMFASVFIAIFVGVNVGILAAWKKKSFFDVALMIFALLGVSIPIFWLGLMAQWLLADVLGWLPSAGRYNVRQGVTPITGFLVIDMLLQQNWSGLKMVLIHLILPATVLATVPLAVIARITRSSMVQALQQDYMRTAKAKGLSLFLILYVHGLKNAILPIVTIIGLQIGTLLGGALLTETIFSWPGIGRYIYDAIMFRDYPVIQASILVISFLYMMINLIVDLLYKKLNSRVEY